MIQLKLKILMKIIFNQITGIEFKLQMLWGFEPNAMHHNSWMWPQCTCPYLDNRHMPPGMMWVTENCPLHGNVLNKLKKKKHVKSI